MIGVRAKIGIALAGLGLALFGLILSLFFEDLIFYNFEQELPLRPGSQSFKKWQLTPVPIIMSVYFWNWTNPHQMKEPEYKPSFVEMGPYVFREVHEKVNVTWNNNGSITFRTVKRYYYDPDLTTGSLDDQVTSLNAVAASVAYIVRSWSKFFLYPVSMALRTSGQELTWTKTVRELLFDGFENTLQNLGSYAPGFPDLDKFGWFYKQNGTVSSDAYTIGTGQNSLNEIGELKLWNYRNIETFYPECPNSGGSNGEFWPPKRTKDDSLKMFTTELCREIIYYFEEESNYEGLKTYVYAGTKDTVDNGTKISDNKCHCQKDFCPPSGVIDASKCQYGAPVFMSYPHFYNADSFYRDSINGMNPDREKHRFYMALEPRTGIQVDVRARMQLNLYLRRNSALSMYRNVTNAFIPIFWMEKSVSLSDEHTAAIKVMLKSVQLGPFICYGICIVGCLAIVGVLLYHFYVCTLSTDKKRKGTIFGNVTFKKPEEIQTTQEANGLNEVEYAFPSNKPPSSSD